MIVLMVLVDVLVVVDVVVDVEFVASDSTDVAETVIDVDTEVGIGVIGEIWMGLTTSLDVVSVEVAEVVVDVEIWFVSTSAVTLEWVAEVVVEVVVDDDVVVKDLVVIKVAVKVGEVVGEVVVDDVVEAVGLCVHHHLIDGICDLNILHA